MPPQKLGGGQEDGGVSHKEFDAEGKDSSTQDIVRAVQDTQLF